MTEKMEGLSAWDPKHIKLQYNKGDPHHKSNWCSVCGLYYCWHPECKEHKNTSFHKFVPMEGISND